ncbi:aspartate-semialdehyde dehydrogenase [Phenylobacterium sp. J367]|uniref:aspartate-semialdehyde dehydrogenase n=1 Tax=Phenylobacterium sp. J367 TaxID=2898435 RepID=UPI0021507067|nr:aspartate-semialdehyde dehydrogenase [Phenylobacterium sp. J367]MCR5878185.1 aspartate-semialdehyde dehydrogenase [Phenylobacterium sp. J367]
MGYRVAVVGATGNVGREMLNILEEVNFPVEKIHAIASRKSIGLEVEFGEKILKCEDVEQFDFSTVDLVLMSVSGAFSKEWAPKIGAAGPIVIDNSSAWRMDPDVPLVVPEVNPDDVEWADRKNIIANPNCSTAQLVVALKPLHDRARIKRVVVATYQSVSGAGKEGMDELFDQTKNVFVLGATPPKKFPKQIAFNVIPFIGSFQDDGYTDEEAKMWNETHKMIDPEIKLTVTCVRVPVMVGHSEAVNIEFHEPLDEDKARDILRESPGLIVIDQRNDKGYMTPKEAQGEFPVFVSRIRNDPTVENGLSMWVVADNLRKGAALNAVQIAELLHARGLINQKALA